MNTTLFFCNLPFLVDLIIKVSVLVLALNTSLHLIKEKLIIAFVDYLKHGYKSPFIIHGLIFF